MLSELNAVLESAGFNTSRTSDLKPRAFALWEGLDNTTVVFTVYVVVPERIGDLLGEFTKAWNAIADSEDFGPLVATVQTAYSDVPPGGTRPADYAMFDVRSTLVFTPFGAPDA